jgi:TolB-like protein/Tfp pilus assembly protein PilF
MMPNDADLLRLAQAVADGSEVNWDQAESSAATGDERSAIEQLRRLAEVGAAARAQAETWGSLRIRGAVGSGSFGTVYRAWDPRLDREVALKLLHADAQPQAAAPAIVREGRLLAQIRHPNVVTIHGADEYDDRVGIWMEFLEGRTLKEIVTEQGPFAASEAALIGADLCRALAAVHRQGFVHRDVKAQNVMREVGGRTVLMDFGASEAIHRHDDAAGPMRGTPVYLAPELLEGQSPSVRSDIYSLGVLLYYLVTGGFPVVGSSLADFRARHAARQRALLQDVRPDVPAAFARAVEACLEPRPEDRPDTAGAVHLLLDEAIRLRPDEAVSVPSKVASTRARRRGVIGAAIASVAVVVLTIAAWMFQKQVASQQPPAVTRRDSIAILPFQNLSGTADDYFSEGITADLIANLSALRDLRVIAGASTRQYSNRQKSPTEIGAELGVATVLDASVRRSGDRVRIVTQLIDARSGVQIWSQIFDRQLAEIVAMKSDVSHRIAVALRGELSQRDMELLKPGRLYDYDAFNLYLRGRHYWGLRTEDSLNRSVQYFSDALTRDPGFAPAFAGLADAYTNLGVYGSIPREEANARAATAAQKAVTLDPSLAEAHASLGLTRKNRFEWQAAEASFRKAIDLKPGYANAHLWYSILLTQLGRFPEAIAEIRIAMSLDPLSVAPKLQFAALLTMARRYDDAVAQYHEALTMDSDFPTVYMHMAQTLMYKGDYVQARARLDEARRRTPAGTDDQALKAYQAYLHAATGRETEALALTRELIERHDKAGEALSGTIAAIYAGLRRPNEAMAWLARARAARDPETGYLLVDPRWDSLRSDPEFRKLLGEMGFPPIRTGV